MGFIIMLSPAVVFLERHWQTSSFCRVHLSSPEENTALSSSSRSSPVHDLLLHIVYVVFVTVNTRSSHPFVRCTVEAHGHPRMNNGPDNDMEPFRDAFEWYRQPWKRLEKQKAAAFSRLFAEVVLERAHPERGSVWDVLEFNIPVVVRVHSIRLAATLPLHYHFNAREVKQPLQRDRCLKWEMREYVVSNETSWSTDRASWTRRSKRSA